MYTKNIIVLIVLLFSLLGFPTKDSADELAISEPILTQDQLIVRFSSLYGSNTKIVSRVIDCESGGNQNIKGDSGKAKGIAQFWEETFNRHSKILGEKLNYDSEYDQIKLLSFSMSKPELAREWTTYRAIMNGGSYTFIYKITGKPITIYCKL